VPIELSKSLTRELLFRAVLDWTLVKGTEKQVEAFRTGFSSIFPIRDLQAFSSDELVNLFGNAEEDWGVDTLNEALKADHGYNIESRSIGNLIEIMSEYEPSVRREFLQFITGAPKLPIGGEFLSSPPLSVPLL
jgi:E3 ubiquitin-protein ligase TRIP12